MGFRFSHRLYLMLPDLTSHFPSPFNLRGKLILTSLQGGIVYCLFKEKLEKLSSVGLSRRYSEFLMGLETTESISVFKDVKEL